MVSRKPLTVLRCSLNYNPFANSPADYRWAIALYGYNRLVKPLPAPHVPGKTDFERFDNAMRQVLTVSKDELLKREDREKKALERKKRAKKP